MAKKKSKLKKLLKGVALAGAAALGAKALGRRRSIANNDVVRNEGARHGEVHRQNWRRQRTFAGLVSQAPVSP